MADNDFVNYQLARSEPDQFLIQHPDGSQFSVARAGLDPQYDAHIANNMPAIQSADDIYKQVHGAANPAGAGIDWGAINRLGAAPDAVPMDAKKFGSVDERDAYVRALKQAGVDPNAAPPSSDAGSDIASNGNGPMGVVPEPLPDTSPVAPPQAGVSGDAPQPGQVPGVAYGNPNDPASMLKAAGQNEQAANFGQYKIAQDVGKQAAVAQQAYLDTVQAAQERNETFQQQMVQANQKLSDDVAKGHIDPNRMWNNMSTGNQILAGISMIAGGLGQGLLVAGGAKNATNAALDVINNAVTRDIDAQKQNLDNKKSLISLNMGQARNMDEATLHSMMNATSIVDGQLKLAMAKSASPEALARLQQAQSVTQQHLAELAWTAATKYGTPGSGGQQTPDGLPQDIAYRIEAAPPSIRDDLKTEVKNVKKAAIAKNSFATILAKMKQVNTVGALANPHAWEDNERYKSDLVETFQALGAAPRLNAEMKKIMKPFEGSTLKSSDPGFYDKAYEELSRLVDQHVPPPTYLPKMGLYNAPNAGGGNAQAIAARQAQAMKVASAKRK